jgi:hypothetical protein
MNIYQIEKQYLEITQSLIDADGELTPELETELIINQQELEKKGIQYGYVVKSIENDIDVIDAEIKRLTAMKKTLNNSVDRLKNTLLNAMEMFEINELKTPTLKINFRKSESIEITDAENLNKRFIVEKVTSLIDKALIKEAIKKGEIVIGATLLTKNNLQIK